MSDEKTRPVVTGPASTVSPDPRPAYERPCLVKKRAVTRATLFSGGGPSSAPPPLVANG